MTQSEGKGFQAIGNLIATTEPLPSNLESNQDQHRQSSGTTGAQSLALRDASSIGRPHGGTVAVRLPAEVETALGGAEAWKTDKAVVALLPPQLRSLLRSKLNGEFDIVGWEWLGSPDLGEAAQALAIVAQTCRPVTATQALNALTRCFAVTKGKRDDEIDIKATLAAMVDGLAEFPADVVNDACRAYARCNVFRPSLAELRDLCWTRFRARENLRWKLQSAIQQAAR